MTAPATADRSVAMIGGGQMALALAEGFCRAGLLAAGDIVVYDPHPPARERLAAAHAAGADDVVSRGELMGGFAALFRKWRAGREPDGARAPSVP